MNNTVTFVGNLGSDPELRYTPNGVAVCDFSVASSRKWSGSDGTETEETYWARCTAWRELAENIAESLRKGQRVIVTGRMKREEYEKDGQQRSIDKVEVLEVGPSLRWARCEVQRNDKSGSPAAANGNLPPAADDDLPF
jgi:single-strand DNA-binding protein